MAVPYKEYRCSGCKKLLFRGWIAEGEVEIKCKGCHTISTLAESRFEEMLCAIVPCPRRIVPKTMEVRQSKAE